MALLPDGVEQPMPDRRHMSPVALEGLVET